MFSSMSCSKRARNEAPSRTDGRERAEGAPVPVAFV